MPCEVLLFCRKVRDTWWTTEGHQLRIRPGDHAGDREGCMLYYAGLKKIKDAATRRRIIEGWSVPELVDR